MEREMIFLVLQHCDVDQNLGCGRQVYHSHGYRRSDGVGVGGNGHDPCCHCLIVRKETYKTREEADKIAEKLQLEHPGDFFFSLEVYLPK